MDAFMVRLIEKIGQAKLRLDELRTDHAEGCYANDQTGFPAPCSCGASKRNTIVDDIVRILTVEKE